MDIPGVLRQLVVQEVSCPAHHIIQSNTSLPIVSDPTCKTSRTTNTNYKGDHGYILVGLYVGPEKIKLKALVDMFGPI